MSALSTLSRTPLLHRSSVLFLALSLSSLCVDAFGQSRGGAHIVVDGTHQKILIQENAERRLPVGDLTKVATAAVVFDWLETRKIDRSTRIIVPSTVAQLGDANFLGTAPGDQMTIRDALFAMLLSSDNAAALTLADYIGRQMMAEIGGHDPVAVFVGQMNALAGSLDMNETHFINPHGLEPRGGSPGLSTAKDMARLAFYVIEIPYYNFIQAQSKRRVEYQRGPRSFAFDIRNTNRILGHHGVESGKASIMPRAGQCLMTYVRKPDRIETVQGSQNKRRIPFRLVTVTLNSPEKFGQTAHLIDQGWAAYESWVAGGLIVRDPAEMLRNSSLAQR